MIKDVLKLYIKVRKEISQIEEEIYKLNTVKNSPKSNIISGMPAAKSKSRKDRISMLLETAEKLYNNYIAKKTELYEIQIKIENYMECLDSVERQLIRWRYINGLKWDEIVEKMGYEYAQLHRIHHRALKIIEDNYFTE